MRIEEIEERLGVKLMTHQHAVAQNLLQQKAPQRIGIFHRMGAGKTITGLTALAVLDQPTALIVAPKSTHDSWIATASKLGMIVTVISVEKFRQPSFKVRKTEAILVDEMHSLSTQRGQGWKKLHAIMQSLEAPLVIMSATPQYNDAERAYCMARLVAADSVAPNFLEFVYRYFETKANPYSTIPKVVGIKPPFKNEVELLCSFPTISYLGDPRTVDIIEHEIKIHPPKYWTDYHVSLREDRIGDSFLGIRKLEERLLYLDDDGMLRDEIVEELNKIIDLAEQKVLVFSNSQVVASAAAKALSTYEYSGKTANRERSAILDAFIDTEALSVLVGTSALATGTDGMDKVCDTLILLVDTDDAVKRKQLIGRILPRGLNNVSTEGVNIHRINMGWI